MGHTGCPREISGMLADVDRLYNQDTYNLLIIWRAFINGDTRPDSIVVPKPPNADLASQKPPADSPGIRARIPKSISAQNTVAGSPCSGSSPRWLGVSQAECGIQLRSARLIALRENVAAAFVCMVGDSMVVPNPSRQLFSVSHMRMPEVGEIYRLMYDEPEHVQRERMESALAKLPAA